jgi:two-component system chemotaxis response regulator CheB
MSTVNVLIVDDSGFFQRRLREMLDSCTGMKVVGTASHGKEALELTHKLKPDVITMDYEMPVMDGITAVRHIMDECPTPILMFSSLTYEGARVTLDALAAGAVDYLPKNFEEISKSSAVLKQKLVERLTEISMAGKRGALAERRAATPVRTPAEKPATVRAATQSVAAQVPTSARAQKKIDKKFSLVAIGTSTGGPVALQNVLTQLPANFSKPIVLIQHMPSTFTSAFAERLNSLSKITVKEAMDGDQLRPGVALLAPGGKQMMISKNGTVKVLPGDERLNYKPCVDVTFASAANVYGDKVLGIVLTGMGADGCEGAKVLKQKGSNVWSQDEKTSVIYGMPMAVAKANLSDEVLPLPQVGARLCELP